MTTAEEIARLLSIEYGSYELLQRLYQKGWNDREVTIERINSRYRVILNLKHRCRQELPEEEYPEEYYLPDPAPAEELLAALENKPDSLIVSTAPLTREDLPTAVPRLPDPDDTGTQLSIFDLYGDCL